MSPLAILSSGNPTHPPLIFLHGFLGCKEDWQEWFSLFDRDYFCVAIDLPGHGDSPYVDTIVETLRSFIQKHFSQKPLCIAYSMGGRIALQLQDIFSCIAALSTHPGLQTEEERAERLKGDKAWAEKLQTLPFSLFLREWYKQPLFHTLRGHLLERIFKRRTENDPIALSKTLLQLSLATQPSYIPGKTPLCFFYGKEDCKYEKLYANLLPRCAISHAGHALHLENPTECAQQIKELFHANGDPKDRMASLR